MNSCDGQYRSFSRARTIVDTASTNRKRTKAEALASQIGAMQNKIGDLDFPSFSTEDREMVTEALTPLKNTLDEALARAAQGSQMLA